MIYLLLFFLVNLFLVAFLFTNDILSPACIICESYIIAVGCAIFNVEKWNISLRFYTVVLILIGTSVFVFVSIFMKNIYSKKNYYISNASTVKKYDNNFNLIYIEDWKVYLLEVMQLIILLLYIKAFMKSAGSLGAFSSFKDLMEAYRFVTSYGDGLDIPISTLVSQVTKISKAFAYISLYVILHNMIICKKLNTHKIFEKKYLFSFILYLPLTILSGGRFELLVFIIAALMIWFILDSYYNKRGNIALKKVFKIVAIVIFCILAFSATRTLVGRESNSGTIEYFSEYFGGSIELLDLYLENPTPKSTILGEDTFTATNKLAYQLGIYDSYSSLHSEFRFSNGVTVGNVYTAYRSYYHDFGMTGVIVLQSLLSIIITLYYENIKIKANKCTINISIIMYCIIIHTIFLNSYREFFYSTVISINYLILLICLIVIKYFLLHIRIKA